MATKKNEEIRKAAEAALCLIESTMVHVSHGGPTRADAEAVWKQLRRALGIE